jgi:hypothetical protein
MHRQVQSFQIQNLNLSLFLSSAYFDLPPATRPSIMTPEDEALFFRKFRKPLPDGEHPDEEDSDNLVLSVMHEFPVEVKWLRTCLFVGSYIDHHVVDPQQYPLRRCETLAW